MLLPLLSLLLLSLTCAAGGDCDDGVLRWGIGLVSVEETSHPKRLKPEHSSMNLLFQQVYSRLVTGEAED